MPQAISSLTSLLPILTTGAQLASAGSNLYQGYENQKYQDMLRSYAGNPQKLQAYEQGFVQPLNAGLVKGVENQAQGYAAERGLAQSPALQQEIIAQALGPYEQQNQQEGYQNALAALGLGGGAKPQDTQSGLTSLFAGLKGLAPLSGAGGTGSTNLSAAEALANQGFQNFSDPTTYSDLTIPLQDFYSANFGGS